MSCIDTPVSILRSKERDSAIRLITHRDIRPQGTETSEQDFRSGTQFHPGTRPGRPSHLTAYYKREHLKFSGRPDDPFSSHWRQYERLLPTHRVGEEDALLSIHAMLKVPAMKFYLEQIEHRYKNVRDALDRIQALHDSPAMP